MAPAGQIVKEFTLARVNLVVGAHALVQRIRQGQTLLLARAPNDKFDKNAVMVILPNPGSKRLVGYLPPGLAKEIAPIIDSGVKVIARKAENPLYGVCQLAYIPAAPAPLPEGVTQADIDAATDPTTQKEDTNDQPAPEADDGPAQEGV